MKITRLSTPILLFLVALIAVHAGDARADDSNGSAAIEKDLLAILRSDAAAAEKAISCKKLAIHGSSKSVTELAKLLPDPQLSSWARIALEAIPGKAASDALQTASNSLQGRLLVGMINSIGVRRDAGAVDSLIERLQDSDVEVASAAAVALGRIGNDDATTSLRAALSAATDDLRSAVAEGCVLCAERLHSEGNSAEAIEIYDQVRGADVPMQRVIEATRGAILARNEQGIPLLIETFQSPEVKLFQLALGTAREFPGGEVDKALAAEMVRATPDRAALIIQAMADRPDTVVLATVLEAAQAGPKQVRLSAIEALSRVGGASSLASLMSIATEDDVELAEAAKETLAGLPSQEVDQQIVTLLKEAKDSRLNLLLELVGRRRIDALSEIMKTLNHSDRSVRHAALIALGETVSPEKMSVLVDPVVRPKHLEDTAVALEALRSASVRMPDREECAATLAAAMARSSTETKSELLEILSEVGGTKALQTLAEAANSGDPALLETSSRLLGKWNDVKAAPVLLDLAKNAASNKYKVRALRGYLGLARKFTSGKQRAEMCQNAIDTAIRSNEQTLALDVLTLRPSVPGLTVAIKAQQRNGIEKEAIKATQAMAKKLQSDGVDVKGLISSADLQK